MSVSTTAPTQILRDIGPIPGTNTYGFIPGILDGDIDSSGNSQKMICDVIRRGGQPFLASVAKTLHPKSQLGKWDPDVYSGVVEQMDIDQFFQWNDCHWRIPKYELLKRVDEWNESLDKYCDNKGLSGLEREAVIRLHLASPFAPCANLKCDKIETKVKEFSRCGKCLSEAYCSNACQKEDYAFHKPRCVKRA